MSDLNSSLRGKDLVTELGLSKGHASGVLSGKQQPSLALSLRIYRRFGVKLGPIIDASKSEIDALEKVARRVAQ